ncbi:hypothetical protein GGF32_007260 [Allomyces javanicus]|nr:hypothetical protein GGF32_007260 [Allomyces javanicus]
MYPSVLIRTAAPRAFVHTSPTATAAATTLSPTLRAAQAAAARSAAAGVARHELPLVAACPSSTLVAPPAVHREYQVAAAASKEMPVEAEIKVNRQE